MTFKNTYKDEEEKLLQDADASFRVEKPAGFDDSVYQAKKPTYTSSYDDRITSLLDSLEDRPEFRYDPESDPAYRQYRDQYRREGQRAVDDTLASAASHAGGMNSYAVTAAQQAGDYYNARLADVLPELTRLAYEMYQADYDEDVNTLKLLQSREAEEYGRYQDSLADWYTELKNAYQQYRDAEADRQWQESFDYGKEQDAIDNQYRQDAFDYGKEQDALAYEKWLAEQAYKQQQADREYGKWQESFDYEKEQEALAYEKWLAEQEYEARRDAEADRQWQEKFDYGKEQDAIDNQYRQNAFDYEKEQDAQAYEKWLAEQAYKQQQDDREYEQWLRELALKFQSSRPEQETPPAVTAPPAERDDPADSGSAAPYTGTNYYQDAINAAVRGDRATAEAALRKREEKMADPAYGGTGGGTSMDTARQYIESLLAASEGAGISERDASGMLDKSEWKEKRASGTGVEASYATYEDYVRDYLRYLTEERV